MITCPYCATMLPSDALFCSECGRAVTSTASRGVLAGLPPLSSPVPQPEPWMNASAVGTCEQCGSPVTPDDIFCGECGFVVESARIADPLHKSEHFVLQFSTGESFTVYGSGLIGRSPKPEPSEYFDHLIRIADASRSVSKTHVEFGQDDGSFWVKDRFSGNGTTVREPESAPARCHPDRRYHVARGSRVDLGEQFFIVS